MRHAHCCFGCAMGMVELANVCGRRAFSDRRAPGRRPRRRTARARSRRRRRLPAPPGTATRRSPPMRRRRRWRSWPFEQIPAPPAGERSPSTCWARRRCMPRTAARSRQWAAWRCGSACRCSLRRWARRRPTAVPASSPTTTARSGHQSWVSVSGRSWPRSLIRPRSRGTGRRHPHTIVRPRARTGRPYGSSRRLLFPCAAVPGSGSAVCSDERLSVGRSDQRPAAPNPAMTVGDRGAVREAARNACRASGCLPCLSSAQPRPERASASLGYRARTRRYRASASG